MTFSILGRCPRSGMFGVAIATSSICVGSRCAWARAGAGAVATQNITDPRLGLRGVALLAGGLGAAEVICRLVRENKNSEYRQLAVIDAQGRTASFSGEKTLGVHSVASDEDCIAAGNLLASPDVPREMARAFRNNPSGRHFAERLLSALEEGLKAGGEIGPVRSAGLLVVEAQPWPLVDLRVDWHDRPVTALRELWTLYEPQMNTFLQRALDPDRAPPYIYR